MVKFTTYLKMKTLNKIGPYSLMLISISIYLVSCYPFHYSVPEPPYIIVDKRATKTYLQNPWCNYTYYSADGRRFMFDDLCEKYTIADTVKGSWKPSSDTIPKLER